MQSVLFGGFILLSCIVLLNLLLTLALIRRVNLLSAKSSLPASLRPMPALSPGVSAPQFSAQNLEGKEVTLDDYAGKPTLFAFVTPTCSICHELFPHFNAAITTSTHDPVQTILVCGATLEQTRHMVEEYHLSLPVISAPSGSSSFFKDYLITTTPSFCYLDENTVVANTATLIVHDAELKLRLGVKG